MALAWPGAFPAGLAPLVLLAVCVSGPRRTGPVVLRPDALAYQSSSTIQITITNQSSRAVCFADHQTNCSVLRLERRAAHAWELVAPCQRLIATRLHTLPAGQSSEVLLTAPEQWPQGVYRVRLDYALLAPQGAAAPRNTSVSRTFRID
ncbi:MAG TPA: hypothetical protein VGF67_01715 [Ktedonobacteraceae bacterium]|jgi:hypothetical protein